MKIALFNQPLNVLLSNGRVHMQLVCGFQDLGVCLRQQAGERRFLLLRGHHGLCRLVLRAQHPPTAVRLDVVDIRQCDRERAAGGAEGLADQVLNMTRLLLFLL